MVTCANVPSFASPKIDFHEVQHSDPSSRVYQPYLNPLFCVAPVFCKEFLTQTHRLRTLQAIEQALKTKRLHFPLCMCICECCRLGYPPSFCRAFGRVFVGCKGGENVCWLPMGLVSSFASSEEIYLMIIKIKASCTIVSSIDRHLELVNLLEGNASAERDFRLRGPI